MSIKETREKQVGAGQPSDCNADPTKLSRPCCLVKGSNFQQKWPALVPPLCSVIVQSFPERRVSSACKLRRI